MSAILVGEDIASQLERRIGFRRAVKQAVGRTMRMGAKGIKVTVSGRLGGAEIARSESYREVYSAADTACEYRLCGSYGTHHLWCYRY